MELCSKLSRPIPANIIIDILPSNSNLIYVLQIFLLQYLSEYCSVCMSSRNQCFVVDSAQLKLIGVWALFCFVLLFALFLALGDGVGIRLLYFLTHIILSLYYCNDLD